MKSWSRPACGILDYWLMKQSGHKWDCFIILYMSVSENRGVFPQIIHFFKAFPWKKNMHFGGPSLFFWKHPYIWKQPTGVFEHCWKWKGCNLDLPLQDAASSHDMMTWWHDDMTFFEARLECLSSWAERLGIDPKGSWKCSSSIKFRMLMLLMFNPLPNRIILEKPPKIIPPLSTA